MYVKPVEEARKVVPGLSGWFLEPCQAVSQEVMTASAGFLADNQAYLEELRLGLAIESCHFEHDLGGAVRFHEAQIFTRAVWMLRVEGRLLLEEGEFEAASLRVLEVLDAAERVSQTDFLISGMVCTRLTRFGTDLLQSLLCSGTIPAERLAAIAERLVDAESWVSLDRMVASEFCLNQHFFDAPDHSTLVSGYGSWHSLLEEAFWGVYIAGGLLDADCLRSAEYCREMLEATLLPEAELQSAVEDVQRRFEASTSRLMVISRNVTQSLNIACFRVLGHRAICRAARTALGVEQYRAIHGALPHSLADLVPGTLESIPADP